MDRKIIDTEKRWNCDIANELLIDDVLNPLLNIIYSYKSSRYYNDAPTAYKQVLSKSKNFNIKGMISLSLNEPKRLDWSC